LRGFNRKPSPVGATAEASLEAAGELPQFEGEDETQ
jgi:hypothetical protein